MVEKPALSSVKRSDPRIIRTMCCVRVCVGRGVSVAYVCVGDLRCVCGGKALLAISWKVSGGFIILSVHPEPHSYVQCKIVDEWISLFLILVTCT